MNPSFMAAMAGMMKRAGPGDKKVKHETSINGRAFAPGKGVQQESGPEKEAKVRKHLDQLAAEAKARSVYPYSDMIVLRDEAQAEMEGTE